MPRERSAARHSVTLESNDAVRVYAQRHKSWACAYANGRRFEIGPHLRFYAQTSASFWQRAYTLVGNDYPALRTGNRELGPLLNFTGGGSARAALGRNKDPRAWVFGIDANVSRIFHITERAQFQLRFEFFNPLNHTNLNNPVSGMTSAAFGRIQSAADPRILQFAGKFSF
jgi:hypothetical protein